MESKSELIKTDIKNRRCYNFDDIIKIKNIGFEKRFFRRKIIQKDFNL